MALQSFLSASVDTIKSAIYDSCTFSACIDDTLFEKKIQIPGKIKSKQYIKTYGSSVVNAAIIVNKVVYYALRLVYIDSNSNTMVIATFNGKHGVGYDEKEVQNKKATIINALQRSDGGFYVDGKYYFPAIKCDCILHQTRRCPSDFILTKFIWWTEPLRSFKKLGSHSKIEVEFTHCYIDDLSISLMIERTQSGVYYEKDYYIHDNMTMRDSAWVEKNHYAVGLKRVSLYSFLLKCNEEDEHKYQLGEHDCHCLAAALWRFCVDRSHSDLPDQTKIGFANKLKINWKLPSGSKATHWKKSIDQVHPQSQSGWKILEKVGVDEEIIFVQ